MTFRNQKFRPVVAFKVFVKKGATTKFVGIGEPTVRIVNKRSA